MKRLVLAGGGHAHLAVLEHFAKAPVANLELVLATPSRYQYYSGMLPGWLAGHYAQAQCRIDLAALAARAGARLIQAPVRQLRADARTLELGDGGRLAYDLLSLDVGSATEVSALQALGDKLLPIKPLDALFARWPDVLQAAQARAGFCLVVVGGGAAGLEVALAAAYALRGASCTASVHLVASESGMLAGHAPSVQQRALRCAQAARLNLHFQRAEGHQDGVRLADGQLLPADCVIAATGAQAHAWLESSGLNLDAAGFVQVGADHRSSSHLQVFAAGDTCARNDLMLQKSGVHAVRAGPVLAHNLRAAITGAALRSYVPRRHTLYLLACGPRQAIASWGGLSAQGRWVWRWKNHIDQGFVRRHSLAKSGSKPAG